MGMGLSAAQAGPIRVGLVLDKGGKDDKSFNAAAFRGATDAQQKLGIQLKVVEATDDNAFEPMLRAFAQKEYDLIVAIGIAQGDAVRKVAPLFPGRKFVIVDNEVRAPNVQSVLFEEHEGSFLVGAAAALAGKGGKFGFIGGMEIPLIRRFELGFAAGARHVNPKAEILSNYVGVTGEAWNNPPKCKEIALSQYDRGAEVIFAAAGASNTGLFDAAEERGRLAIGVDSNQNWIKPGRILTSMLKRVDLAVYRAIEQVAGGKFAPGVLRHGLADGGIDYAVDSYNEKLLTPGMRSRLEAIKKDVIGGKIRVPDYYKKGK